MFYSNKKSSSAEVNSCCFSAISQFLQEHISHFPNQIPLAMPTCSAHVFMFLQTPFHWVWWQMTEWRREYFDILPQYCSRLGVLLASISNMFCVACGLTDRLPQSPSSSAHSYSAAQGLNERVVPTITSGYSGYTSTDQRWLLGGLNGPAVMWSSTKPAYITWPLYACSVMGMLAWCCGFLGITVNWILCPTVLWMLIHSLLPSSQLSQINGHQFLWSWTRILLPFTLANYFSAFLWDGAVGGQSLLQLRVS